MKVYVVQNADQLIMGIFSKKSFAKSLVNKGFKKWGEDWSMTTIEVDDIEQWILDGNSDRCECGKRKNKCDMY
jgi:hypothetical protein